MHSEAQAPATRRAPLVFIADDDDGYRAALCATLRNRGYRVQEAANGAQALERLASAADGHAAMPDLVMLDVCMPEFSGLGVLSLIRRFKRPPPTFVVTGFAHSSIDLIANRRGAVTVFHKPIDLDQLVAAIESAIPPR